MGIQRGPRRPAGGAVRWRTARQVPRSLAGTRDERFIESETNSDVSQSSDDDSYKRPSLPLARGRRRPVAPPAARGSGSLRVAEAAMAERETLGTRALLGGSGGPGPSAQTPISIFHPAKMKRDARMLNLRCHIRVGPALSQSP
jgi:hypothetical protein